MRVLYSRWTGKRTANKTRIESNNAEERHQMSIGQARADIITIGENVFLAGAKIVDCGDAPLTVLVSESSCGIVAARKWADSCIVV